MTVAAPAVDGRRRRRQQNRQAVLDALVALFRQGVYQPSAAQIAERAGISARSLFRYFDDVDDLSRAAIGRLLEQARPLGHVVVDPTAPAGDRVAQLVASRVRLFGAIAPAARAARACAHRNPVVAAQVTEGRAFLRRQVRQALRPELSGARMVLAPAAEALCSFETYDLLRADHGLSATRTEAALVAGLSALLGVGPAGPARGPR